MSNGNSTELCLPSFQLQRIKLVLQIFLLIIKLQHLLTFYGHMQISQHLGILKPQGSKLHHKVVYVMAEARKAKWKIAWNNNMRLSISATKFHHVLWECSRGYWIQNKRAENLGTLNKLLQRATTNARHINPSSCPVPQTFIQGQIKLTYLLLHLWIGENCYSSSHRKDRMLWFHTGGDRPKKTLIRQF